MALLNEDTHHRVWSATQDKLTNIHAHTTSLRQVVLLKSLVHGLSRQALHQLTFEEDHWSAGEFYVDTELAAWHAEESFLGLDKLGGDADDAMLEDETPDSIGISDCRSMSCDDLLADNTLATPAARADALTDSCDGTRFEQQVPSTHEQQNGLVANVELGLYGGMTNDETDYVDPDIALSAFHATLGAPYVFRDDMDILLGNYVTELVGGEVEGWSVASVGAHMVAVLDVEDPDLGFCASTYMMPSYHLVPVLDHHREHSPLHTATLKTAD